MTKFANRHRRDIESVNDMVFLKLRPYQQQSVCRCIHQKLSARFYGPFKIVELVGKVAYKLLLLEGSRIHPAFHVSRLRKMVGNQVTTVELPQELDSDLVLNFEP